MNASLSRCMRCGSNDVEDKDIEKLVRGGNGVATLRVRATVCHHFETLYEPLVDAWMLYDSAGEAPTLLDSGGQP